jgi:hypothetical protein
MKKMFEEKLFQMEIAKRKKSKLEWKYHTKSLFKPETISFNSAQINLIKNLLFTPMSRHRRAEYWFVASGAKREMLNNKGYYQSLLNNFPNGIQSPTEKIIELDVPRTFPSDPFFKEEENRKKLINILTAFVRRDSTIGYSQGFNCIAGKLLMVVKEEEKVFWIFTQIIENYLPGDFYLLFTGVRKDMKIIQDLIKKTLTFCDQSIIMCLNNLISKTFISLFSRGLPNDLTFQIWDAFFIYGEIILYRTFIWIAYFLCDKSLVNKDIEEVSGYINDKMNEIEESGSLSYFLFMYNSISNSDIKKWKKKIEKSVEAETYLGDEKSNDKAKCDKTLPFCLYNNEEKNISKNSKFIVHKMNHEIKLYDNYFFEEINSKPNDINDDDYLNTSQDSLMIQRQKHICP